MKPELRDYFAEIGRKGGRKSRRHLTADEAKSMVRVREARRAFKKYHAQCFWSYSPEYRVTSSDIPWVVEQLKKHGNREAWELGARLCR